MLGVLRSSRGPVRAALALLFVAAASARLVYADALAAIVPEWLPLRREAVHASGVLEAAGGIGLLVPALRRPAGVGLALLLVVIFPANVNMAVNNVQVTEQPIPPILLWARLPIQGLLIWLVLWASRDDAASR